jgi:hypothetical protein
VQWALKNGAVSIEEDDAWAAARNKGTPATQP